MSSESSKVEQLKHQLAADFVSMLSEALDENCFKRCITKPTTKLEKAEESCLARCMDRYMDAWNITGSAVARLQEKLSHE